METEPKDKTARIKNIMQTTLRPQRGLEGGFKRAHGQRIEPQSIVNSTSAVATGARLEGYE